MKRILAFLAAFLLSAPAFAASTQSVLGSQCAQANPAILGDHTTGFDTPGAGEIGACVAGTQLMTIGTAGVTFSVPVGTSSGGTGATSLGNNFTNNGSVFNLTQPINDLSTDATYTVLASDMGKWLTNERSSSVAITLQQAGTTGFSSGAGFCELNNGTGVVTITPTTSTINGNSTLVLAQGQFACITSNGSNYIALAGQATTASASTFNATSGTGYTILGNNALSNPQGDATSFAIGGNALSNAPSGSNYQIAIGQNALEYDSTTACCNIAIGDNAEENLSTGGSNLAMGTGAMQSTSGGPITSSNLVAIGAGSMRYGQGNIYDNAAVGGNTLSGNPFTGTEDAAFGYDAFTAATSGNNDTGVGSYVGQRLTTGSRNTFVGQSAGNEITTGNNNTAIGFNSGNTNLSGSSTGNILIGTTASCDVSGSGNSYETHICGSSADSITITGNNTVSTEAVTINGIVKITGAGVVLGATNTPADNATCTAGTFWWDTSYIYVCTVSGTIKRATLSTY